MAALGFRSLLLVVVSYLVRHSVAYPGGVLWVLQHPPCATASSWPSEKNMLRNTNRRIFLQ